MCDFHRVGDLRQAPSYTPRRSLFEPPTRWGCWSESGGWSKSLFLTNGCVMLMLTHDKTFKNSVSDISFRCSVPLLFRASLPAGEFGCYVQKNVREVKNADNFCVLWNYY